MRTYADGLAAIQAIDLLPTSERLPLAAAAGRVLAEAIRLSGDQPPFDRATMDGYALCLKDGATRYRVRGIVHAGTVFSGDLAEGEALRIMTGAPCPPGTTVVPHELTDRGVEDVTITDAKALVPARNIARRGEDGRSGALVAASGTTLTPLVLAAVAMAGAREVTVSRRPRLTIVTTGDEVGAHGPAGINDSNGPFLLGFAAAFGLETTRTHAADHSQALRDALEQALGQADIVVTSGGVSAGDRDLVPALAGELGFTTVFHHLAMQPGKPVLLAQRGRQFIAGLPGNPVSVVATAHLILLPLLARLLGAPAPAWLELPLTVPWTHRGNRQLFLPARITSGGVAPIRWNGSGDLLAAASGDGLIDLAPTSELAVGQLVRVLPYVGWRPGQTSTLPPRDRR